MSYEKYNVIHKQVGPFKLTGYLETDQWPESPQDWGYGHLALFTHGSIKTTIETYKDNPWAFPIGCYEHGNTMYFLQGEGPNCRFDSTSFCGYYCLSTDSINYIEQTEKDKVKQIEKAKQYARQELEIYTDWVNGDVYQAVILSSNASDTTEPHVEDSVGNIYGYSSAKQELEEALKNTEQRFRQILNKRHKKFTELLKSYCNTSFVSNNYPQKYLGFYIPKNSLNNRPAWISCNSAETVINIVNKKQGQLLKIFELDTKENTAAKEINFTTGYTLIS